MNPSAENKRIEYIDTAKGICILLVVVNHIDVFTAYSPLLINEYVSSILSSFRMPLYFILSGLFFKEYSGLAEFSALPFFAFGHYVRHAGLLQATFTRRQVCFCLIVCILVLCTFHSPIDLMYNQFESNFGLYACGITGTILVLTLSQLFGRIHRISYFGRYSIIILCTNRFVIAASIFLLHKLHCPSRIMFGCIFFITMLLYLLVIPVMRRYCPHVTAQKDLFKPNT